MKAVSQSLVWIFFFALMVGNVFVFVQGITLSDEIHTFESEIKRLRQENTELETKIFRAESIVNAASVAADLDYDTKSEPVFFNGNRYALNQ
jgi:cell division protein FtsL